MTYTSDNSSYQFFVVGGDTDGTDTGRIYFYRYLNAEDECLYDYGTSATNWSNWTVSQWTSNTILALTVNASRVISDTQAAHVGVSTVADLHTLGFDGSKLFTGVKIL